jgi:hypothetical protein
MYFLNLAAPKIGHILLTLIHIIRVGLRPSLMASTFFKKKRPALKQKENGRKTIQNGTQTLIRKLTEPLNHIAEAMAAKLGKGKP